MTDAHHAFFKDVNWFGAADCERLDEELAWARAECPVVHSDYDGGMHVVTTYDDLRTVGSNPTIFSSAMPGVMTVPVALPPLDSDLPIHKDFRGFLNRYFSRSYLDANYRTDMERIADDLIDGFVERGQVEFVGEFAIPFTSTSLAKVVLDDKDEERLARAVDAVTRVGVEGTPEAHQGVAMIAAELMQERVAGDDFLSGLVSATVDGGRALTQAEMLGVVTVLLLGGLDTTRGAIAYIGEFLAERDDVEERMRRPEWTRRDLDEFLRHTSTVSVMGRVLTEDTELLGCPMKKGERLAVHWRSGNRDATKFDRPDELVFDRDKNPHIAFGVGIHRCLGQHFARLQIEIAFNRLLRRVTNLRIADGMPITRVAGISLGAPEEMHLVFDRA